jgi:hypothetical protein
MLSRSPSDKREFLFSATTNIIIQGVTVFPVLLLAWRSPNLDVLLYVLVFGLIRQCPLVTRFSYLKAMVKTAIEAKPAAAKNCQRIYTNIH